MKRIHVTGLGLWTPGFPSPAAWQVGTPDPAAKRPTAALIDARSRRRCSLLTRMAIEVFEQAVTQAGVRPAETPAVFGSAQGELLTSIGLLEQLSQGDGELSPTRFHNSVHNTASGYVSIAAESRAPYSSLSGGDATVAMALLDAWLQLDERGGHVALVLMDEAIPEPLAPAGENYDPLALAFVLAAEPPAGGSLGVVSNLRRDGAAEGSLPERFARNPVAGGLPLMDALLDRGTGRVMVDIGPRPRWCLDLDQEG